MTILVVIAEIEATVVTRSNSKVTVDFTFEAIAESTLVVAIKAKTKSVLQFAAGLVFPLVGKFAAAIPLLVPALNKGQPLLKVEPHEARVEKTGPRPNTTS